ncbi:outer membrane beta-barrel protein [Kaarinaea lacus]
MRLLKIIIFTQVFISFSTAQAVETRDERNQLYLGVNVGSYLDLFEDNALGGTIQVGYDLHKFLAIETHLGLAYDSYEETAGGLTLSAKSLISHASVYLRGNLRFDTFTLFAVGGYTYLRNDYELEITPPIPPFESRDDTTSESDISYGGGIDLYGNATTAVTFKWMRVIDMGDEGELDAWYIGITHYLDN